MVALYCAATPCWPASVTLGIDDTLDVVLGHRQLSMFNAHYEERCFLPIHVYWHQHLPTGGRAAAVRQNLFRTRDPRLSAAPRARDPRPLAENFYRPGQQPLRAPRVDERRGSCERRYWSRLRIGRSGDHGGSAPCRDRRVWGCSRGRQWANGHNRFKELRRRGVSEFRAAVAAGSPTGFWRMSGHPAVQAAHATTTSTRSVSPDSTFRPQHNPIEPRHPERSFRTYDSQHRRNQRLEAQKANLALSVGFFGHLEPGCCRAVGMRPSAPLTRSASGSFSAHDLRAGAGGPVSRQLESW
jgi:hypothetical protein